VNGQKGKNETFKLTVHDCMAAVKFEGIVQSSKSLRTLAITVVSNPSVSLHQNSRSQISVAIPPVAWARG